MLTIRIFSPTLLSWVSNGEKSLSFSHAGLRSPVGVILQVFLCASPYTGTPHPLKKSTASAAYLSTVSAPSIEYGCSFPRAGIALIGSSTGVPSGNFPRRSKLPDEKCIAFWPDDTIAHFFPAFWSLIPHTSPARPPPIMTVSNLISFQFQQFHNHLHPQGRRHQNKPTENTRSHAACRPSIQDTYLSIFR